MICGIRLCSAAALFGMLVLAISTPAQARMRLHVAMDPPGGVMTVGQLASLVFRIDSCEDRNFTRIICPLVLRYSNNRVMGPIMDVVRLSYSDRAVEVFDHITWTTSYSLSARGPDTTRIVMQQPQEGLAWDTCGELWRMTFTPVDTGTITIDALLDPADSGMRVETSAGSINFEWESTTITVLGPCPIEVAGDLNGDGQVAALDILCLARFVFLDGYRIYPCDAAGDINCDGRVAAGDVIGLARHLYTQGDEPCDICLLVRGGVWRCP